MLQLRLQHLFLTLTAIAVCLAVYRLAGPELALYCALLIGIAVFYSRRFSRFRGAILAISCLIAVSPFFGPPYAFVVPGTMTLLPICELALPHYLLRPFYACGELPFLIVGNLTVSGDFHDVIFFPGSFAVRPFFVFAFWTGIALTMACSSILAKMRISRNGRSDSARQLPVPSTEVAGLD